MMLVLLQVQQMQMFLDRLERKRVLYVVYAANLDAQETPDAAATVTIPPPGATSTLN